MTVAENETNFDEPLIHLTSDDFFDCIMRYEDEMDDGFTNTRHMTVTENETNFDEPLVHLTSDDFFDCIMRYEDEMDELLDLRNHFAPILMFLIFLMAILAKIVWKHWPFLVKSMRKERGVYFVEPESLVRLHLFLKSAQTSKDKKTFFEALNSSKLGFEKVMELFPTDFRVNPDDVNDFPKLFGGECPQCFVRLQPKIDDD
uniref:Uncharacterized protein n=1 Tax=Panagrolaimus sp. JU765 TaxID=591449 RepID=A0AC34R6M2_9BILA